METVEKLGAAARVSLRLLILFSAVSCFLARRLPLRSGFLELSAPASQPPPLASTSGLRSRSSAIPDAGSSSASPLDPLAYRSGSWGDSPDLRLHAMTYDVETLSGASDGSGGSSGVVGTALAAALSERGGQVVSLLAPGVLLVVAPPGVAEAVAAEAGAELAELGPQQRTAPEWGPLLSQAPAEAGTGGLPLQRRRRRLSGGGDREAAAARTEALSRLQTLLPATVPGGAEHERRRRRHLAEAVEPPPLYELSVQLLPVLTAAAVEAAEEDWPAALEAALAATAEEGSPGGGLGACAPLVAAPRGPDGGAVVSARSLHVFVCEQDIGPAVHWLACQPVVRWVAPELGAGANSARASIIMQTGSLYNDDYDDPFNARRPYWEAGLDGRDEIVGVGDTGLDLSHCHFADPRWSAADIAGSMNRSAPGGDPHWRPGPGAHRKLVQYWLAPGAVTGDAPDEGGGHGTAVVGTLGGVCLASMDPFGNGTLIRFSSPDSSSSEFNTPIQSDVNSTDPSLGPLIFDLGTGGAPRAKISFVDMGVRRIPGTWSQRYQYPILPPWPMDTNYLPLHTSVGASILSDSWSMETNVYEQRAQAFDRFLWRNPDVVSFTAVGNNGTTALTRGGTIGTPASAKNVVGVGASVPLPWSGYCYALLARGYSGGFLTGPRRMSMTVWPLENGKLPSLWGQLRYNVEVRLTIADPLDACTPLKNPRADTEGAVVLVKRSNCSYAEQVAAVEAAGGVAVIIINNLPDMMRAPPDPVLPNGTLATRLPTSAIPQGVGDWLLGNATSGLSLSIVSASVGCDTNAVPAFSSYGFMPDGRVKPDVVAPGMLMVTAQARNTTSNSAALPGGECFTELTNNFGTSFATPQASGAAALMRQYLRKGFYPTGDPTSPAAAPFTPSGILIKALTIAGARDLAGGTIVALGSKLGPAPHPYQGWGRMDLSRSLPLKSPGGQAQAGPSTGPNLTLVDRANFTAAGQQLVLTGINATGQGPITIVLMWYDFAADLDSTVQLVNDLDLEVALGSGASRTVVLGNNGAEADSPAPDRVNTVERVLLSSPPAGAPLTVTVRAASLPSALLSGDPDAAQPQRFAVVALGAFRGGFESALNPAFARAQQQDDHRKKVPPKAAPKKPRARTLPLRRKPPPQRAPPPERRRGG